MTRSNVKTLLAAGAVLFAGLTAIPAASFAGECPADKTGVDVRQPVDFKAEGVTDTVIASLPLSKTVLKIDDRTMRVRRLIIQPGGIVPWHSHADRPALIVTVKGEIIEYASTCAAPIVHTAGDATPELPATSHWWKNLSDQPVELLSFDILHDPADTNM